MTSGQQPGRTAPDHARALAAVSALAPARPAAALVHLLTPRSCAVGVQARLDGPRLVFRGRSVTLPADLGAAAAAVADLVAATRHEQDTFCALDADPARWLKPVRSGAQMLLAGTGELFDAPAVRVAAEAASAPVLTVLARAVARRRPQDLAVLGAWGWRVQVLPEAWVVSTPPRGAGPADGPGDLVLEAARSSAAVARSLGAVRARWVPGPGPFPGTVTVVGALDLADGSRVEVPVTQAAGSCLVGVPSAEICPGVSGVVFPRGFAPVGLRLADGVSVVEHVPSGVRAALTGRPAAASAGSRYSQEEQ